MEDILGGAGQAFEGGWNKVKLYFMLGLPTETEEDMRAKMNIGSGSMEEILKVSESDDDII